MEKTNDTRTRRHIGSADADRVVRIARNGQLNESDRQRIAILIGIENQKQFTNRAMQNGIDVENHIFDIIRQQFPTAQSNIYYRSDKLSKQFGFEIGTHPDFEIVDDDTLIWIENKATQDSADDTATHYIHQLAWHQMLGIEKAHNHSLKHFRLYLSHYHVTDLNAPFLAENFTIREVATIKSRRLDYRRMRPFSPFLAGLKIIADEIRNGFDYQPREEIYADNLPAPVSKEIRELANSINEIKRLEAGIENFKRNILELMQAENIKSIRNDIFTLTVVAGSQTTKFDNKTFASEHPDLAEKYTKTVERKPYLLINTKQ